MMLYTHVAVGVAGSLALAVFGNACSPDQFMVAAMVGAIGSAAVDVDVRDKLHDPKITDSGRTKLAVLGIVAAGIALDLIFQMGVLSDIIGRGIYAIVGLALFAIIMLIGFGIGSNGNHRAFSHSILFIVLSSIGVYLVYPPATIYYALGSVLHLLLDLLNHPVVGGHGIWLLYPIKIGKGIALKWCKASGTGNKVFYFLGIILFLLVSAFYSACLWLANFVLWIFIPAVIIAYMIIIMHLVRKKSEREIRHLKHIQGEL